MVGTQVAEDDAGQASFEAAQGFGVGVTAALAVAVVGSTGSLETDLGDGDAVQCRVELAIA